MEEDRPPSGVPRPETDATRPAMPGGSPESGTGSRRSGPGHRTRRDPHPARPLPEAGWREWVALPELGVERIKAKLDSGARSSAIHVVSWELLEGTDPPMVRFVLAPVQGDEGTLVEAQAPLADRRRVRSSSGTAQLRPVIITTLEMAGERWPIELTLARRPRLRFRMLLGRQALRNRVLLDPAGSFMLGWP